MNEYKVSGREIPIRFRGSIALFMIKKKQHRAKKEDRFMWKVHGTNKTLCTPHTGTDQFSYNKMEKSHLFLSKK